METYFNFVYAAETLDPKFMDAVHGLFDKKTKAQAEKDLRNAGDGAIPALRAGMRLADSDQRWEVFEYACRRPSEARKDPRPA